MSWRPPSELLARVERYLYNLGSAASVAGEPFGDFCVDTDMMAERTLEVRRGIGSSGFVDWANNGRKGRYGSWCSRMALLKLGLSIYQISIYISCSQRYIPFTFKQIPKQYKDILNNISTPRSRF